MQPLRGLYKIQDGSVYLGSLVGQNGPAKSIRLQSKNGSSSDVWGL